MDDFSEFNFGFIFFFLNSFQVLGLGISFGDLPQLEQDFLGSLLSYCPALVVDESG